MLVRLWQRKRAREKGPNASPDVGPQETPEVEIVPLLVPLKRVNMRNIVNIRRDGTRT